MALWPWPLTFLNLKVFHVRGFSCLTRIPIFIILRLLVIELRVLNIWSHFRYLKQSLRMLRVTWPLTGGKNSLHFWNRWPQFAYSLCYFQGATTKIKPCYRQKNSVFPLWRLQSLLRMRSITWPVHRRSPKTTRNNFFLPRIVYSLYNFYGATMSIKGTFILEHPHVKAIFGRKKTVQPKSVPEMAVFRKFKGPNIKYSHRDPQKALPYPERRHLTYFA